MQESANWVEQCESATENQQNLSQQRHQISCNKSFTGICDVTKQSKRAKQYLNGEGKSFVPLYHSQLSFNLSTHDMQICGKFEHIWLAMCFYYCYPSFRTRFWSLSKSLR